MGPEGLIPGMHDLDTTALAPQMLAAELEQRLAGSPQQQREQGPFGGEDERMECMRECKDAMARGHRDEVGLAVCDPLRLGEGLTRGTVTIAARVIRVALKAALWTLFRVSPEVGGATDDAIVHHLLMTRRTREAAQEVAP